MSAADTSGHAGALFERRIADTYRALGYQVEANVEVAGQQVDVLARREVEGGPRVELAVECKDHRRPIGNQAAQEFIATIASLRAAGRVTGGVLVSANGFTAGARAIALEVPYVDLLSAGDLAAQLFNVRAPMGDFVRNYERDPIFTTYLSVEAAPVTWADPAQRIALSVSFDELLADWTASAEPDNTYPVFVLADFGAGKTTLLRRIQYQRAKAYLSEADTRIPLFVPLRNHRQSGDITTLLRASFREAYYRDLSPELLWRRLADGMFYVLLDGFDEMAERSDAYRRNELFGELLPVLRSASPSLLTSRPSYLVQAGELNQLLDVLRRQEAGLSGGSRAPATTADRLRRTLVARHRESRPGLQFDEPLREVRAVRILPLSRERIGEFARRREPELNAAGTSAADIEAFIERTYDLLDLATRPLLLTMIVDSVVFGGLDINDSARELGPSALYETYTTVKLDLDLAKGIARRTGLNLETRRRLSEAIALLMYERDALDLDFADALKAVMARDDDLRAAIGKSGLAWGEVETDIATCSFITVDETGACRFIHKSFREFFVARVLKNHIVRGHPLWGRALEREVLYFVGGFSPTDSTVADGLWSQFTRGEGGAVLRRNLFGAYLHTAPRHDLDVVSEVEIDNLDYARLEFHGSRLRAVTWRECNLGVLAARGGSWRDVRLEHTRARALDCVDSDIDLEAHSCTVEHLELVRSEFGARICNSAIVTFDSSESTFRLGLDGATIGAMRLGRSRAEIGTVHGGGAVGSLESSESYLKIVATTLSSLKVSNSVVVHAGVDPNILNMCVLSTSIVFLNMDPSIDDPIVLSKESVNGIDGDSVLFFPTGLDLQQAENCRCGLFGNLRDDGDHFKEQAPTPAWGVLGVDAAKYPSLPHDALGWRHGGLLLVPDAWYWRHLAGRGRISFVRRLTILASGDRHPTLTMAGPELRQRIGETRVAVAALGRNAKWGELPAT